MKRPRIAIAATVLFAVLLLLLLAVPAMAAPHPVIPTDDPSLQGPAWIDGTTMLGVQEKQYRQMAARLGAQAVIKNSPQNVQPAAFVGQTFTVDVSDMSADHPGTYTEHFVVQSIGTHGIICVTQAAWDSFDGTNYYFDNPNGNGSSTWMRTQDLITRGQLSYLLNSFDTTIWNKEAPVWGTPLARGSEGQKVWILIYNLKDDAYYHASETTYVAGYFSGSEDAQNNKNMMHIDTYDWADRIGANAARPFLYEGVFAHEYQHLLHADIDPDEEAWVDEGMADLAAFLCGYMEDNSHVMYYLVFHPFTALTFWGGGLESYGASYLFQLFLWENYGGNAFTKALVHDQANGIQGVQDQLNRFGRGITFSKVFDNWTLANFFDRTGPSKYGYKNIDLGPDTGGWTIPDALVYFWGVAPLSQPLSDTGSNFWGAAYSYPFPTVPISPQPYTAQYFLFDNNPNIKAFLDGDNQAGIAAHSGSYEMVSGQGAWAWKSIFKEAVPITAGTNALSFWTWFDIEQDWDYGYVEVYDENSQQWSTMPVTAYGTSNVLTTNTLPQIQDNPNVPAGREPSDYYSAGRWNAFTGPSNGWVHGNVDLSSFLGHTIDIYFRTWQDGSFTLQMMYVDDVRLQYGSTDYLENFDSGMGQWETSQALDTGPWTRGTGLYANNWQGTLVSIGDQFLVGPPKVIPVDMPPLLKVFTTPMNPATQSGTVNGTPQFKQLPRWLYIVSNRADHIIASDYYLHVWR